MQTLLSPELGNYKIETHPSFKFEQGEIIDFQCPICHIKLASDRNPNLARIIMQDKDKNEFGIQFSVIAGEESTFKIVGKKAVEAFGKDSENYIDFFNLSQTL